MNLRIRRKAQNEIIQITEYYSNIRSDLKTEFLVDLDAVVDLILKFPEGAPVVFKGFRKKLLLNFPYAIYYKTELNIVRIYAVIHERRNQSEWVEPE